MSINLRRYRRFRCSPSSRTRRATDVVLAGTLLAVLTWPAGAAGQPRASDGPYFTTRYDSRLRFRTIRTERFDVHFHQREEPLAARLATFVDDVARDLERRLGTARGRTQVIVVDQTDRSNGWATVIPYNMIEITAASPDPQTGIGNSDDWLRLVFTHEYTHVLHLEQSRGWLGSLRHVFGRLPLFYPNLALPMWQIEGIATYAESAVTGRGRVPAGDFRMLLDGAAASRRFLPLDRASGGVIDWPSGNIPYLYGAYFHQYLADRYGAESLRRLSEETARRLPYFGSLAFRRVYGRSLGDLWEEFKADATTRAREGSDVRTRLTRHGFVVSAPAFDASGRLFYSASNPHGFPSIHEWRADISEPRQVATRFGGDRLVVAGDTLVFDQLEVVAQVGLQSDLYAASTADGRSRRLTRDARASEPDVAGDGRTVVCTVQQADRKFLATFEMPRHGEIVEPRMLLSEPDTQFSAPRWSPDGRSIVATRQRVGGPSEIVIVDLASRAVRPVVASAAARNVLPSWLPDGGTVLFSSDRDGGSFTLYALDVHTGTVRRVASAGPGAQSATLSPDGRRLVFVGYSPDGYDLYSIPFDVATWEHVAASEPAGPWPLPDTSTVPSVSGAPYRPWRTLTPQFWTPVVESKDDDVLLGAATAGYDALGRHGFAAYGAWAMARGQADWQVDYTYARWVPTLFASVSRETNGWRSGEVQSHELTAGGLLPVRRIRWNMTSLAALHTSQDRVICPSCDAPVDRMFRRNALRGAWTFSSAKSYGYSISAEEGMFVRATSEVTRPALGADGSATAFTSDVRIYLRAAPRHGVIAARAAGAAASGDEAMRRLFTAAGSGPQGGGIDFGPGAIGLLRGFDEADLVGRRAVVGNVDYRLPLAWVQRGVGTLPFMLRNVHAAVFADVGHAWDEGFRAADLRRSVGVELSFDAVVGYSLPLTFTTGVAWRSGGGDVRGAAFFGRIGRAF